MGLFGHGDDPFWTDPLFDDETFDMPSKRGRKRNRKGGEAAPIDGSDDIEVSEDPVGDLIDALKPYRKS